MPKPDATSERAAMPGDDLERQVDDMLDALEQQAEALFDSIGEESAADDADTNSVIASVVADAEPPAATADAPTPIAAPSEPAPAEAVADTGPITDDRANLNEPDDALDQAIAQAVADAEVALDDAQIETPSIDAEPIGSATDDDDSPIAQPAATDEPTEASPTPTPAPVSPAISQAPAPATAPTSAPAPAPVPAAAEATPGKFSGVASAASRVSRAIAAKATPILRKAGAAALQLAARPLVFLSPTTRDYLGYAAAVTAFMGLCVWILSLI